jgi:hypothetical protein
MQGITEEFKKEFKEGHQARSYRKFLADMGNKKGSFSTAFVWSKAVLGYNYWKKQSDLFYELFTDI